VDDAPSTGGLKHEFVERKSSRHHRRRSGRRLARRQARARYRLRTDRRYHLGIIGAFIASWLFPQLGIALGTGWIRLILNSTIGAVILLIILRLIRGGGRW